MTAPELASRLEDILEAIAAIAEYTAGKTLDDYVAERMLRDAVERNIERISEASRHIPDRLKARHPEIEWAQVAGIGNILRHAYPIIEDGVIWEWWRGTCRRSKPRSRRCCARPKRTRSTAPEPQAAIPPIRFVCADTSAKKPGIPWVSDSFGRSPRGFVRLRPALPATGPRLNPRWEFYPIPADVTTAI
jgi:uncharacterized protein with HEPN domain